MRPRRLNWLKPTLALAAVASGVAVLRAFNLSRPLLGFIEFVREAGAVGALAFGGVYVAAAVLVLPASVLTLVAGFMWGPWLGLAIVLPVALLGATAAFWLGRTAARGWVEKKLGADVRLQAIDQAVGSGGFRLVCLLRLSPLMPFNLMNYLLGLTRVSTRDFVLGSMVGMAPGTFMYVYLGSLLTSATQLLSGQRAPAGPWGQVLSVAGVLATVGVAVFLTRLARRALSKTLASNEGAP